MTAPPVTPCSDERLGALGSFSDLPEVAPLVGEAQALPQTPGLSLHMAVGVQLMVMAGAW